jgi:general stress protein 26
MDYDNIEKIHLANEEALKKIKQIVDDQKVCMMYMNLGSFPFKGLPMTVQEVDEEGVIWFYSPISSSKNDDIRENDQMMLSFIDSNDYNFMSLYGSAFISTDHEKIKSLWSPMANAWFEGKDDPHIALIGFKIEHGEFQQSKDYKIVALAKLTMSAMFNADNQLKSTQGSITVG